MGVRPFIDRALSGRGEFALYHGLSRSRVPGLPTFAASSGIGVLWPLLNTPDSVWALLRALADGVVPVLVPGDAPPGRLADLRKGHPNLGYFDGQKIVPPSVPGRLDPEIFLVVPTSGSTGEPKLVAAGSKRLAAAVDAIAGSQGLDPVTHTGVLLPMAHAYALVNQLLWALLAEKALTLMDRPAWTDRVGILRGAGIGMTCMVGAQARALVSLGFTSLAPIWSLRVCNFAGGPFPVDTCHELRRLFPGAVFMNNYGCTEAMPRLTACKVTGPDHDVRDVGPPVDGIRVRIAGGEDTGHIEFNGPSISLGFLGEDGELRRHGEWVAAGDTGQLQGGRLQVLGRHDQVIKVAGERVSLLEVEMIFTQAGAVHAAAWAVEGGEKEPVVLVAVQRGTELDWKLVRRSMRERLPPSAWPERVFRLHDWPLLPGQKTDRAAVIRGAESGGAECLWEKKV